MYDNTLMGSLIPIASQINTLLETGSPEVWQNLLEKYHEIP